MDLTQGTTATTAGEVATFKRALLADPCAYCGASAALLDHIVAVANGGGGAWDNFAPSCWACNAQKGPRSLLGALLYARMRPLLDEFTALLEETKADLFWLGRG